MDNEMMHGFTPYESFMVAEKTSRRPSSGTTTAIVLGGIGTAIGIGAWLFGPILSAQRSKGVEKLVEVTNANTNNTLDRLSNLLYQERAERVAQGVTMSQSITDSISGQQQGSQNQATSVENSAMAQATSQLLAQSLLGNVSENPQKVQIYSAPQPCSCPNCG